LKLYLNFFFSVNDKNWFACKKEKKIYIYIKKANVSIKLLLQKPADQSRQTKLAKFALSSFSFPIKEKKSHDYLWIKSFARPDSKVLFEVLRARTEGLPVIPRHPYINRNSTTFL
jgi:hypothetical protein